MPTVIAIAANSHHRRQNQHSAVQATAPTPTLATNSQSQQQAKTTATNAVNSHRCQQVFFFSAIIFQTTTTMAAPWLPLLRGCQCNNDNSVAVLLLLSYSTIMLDDNSCSRSERPFFILI
jgi:hypothetical protein